MTWRAREEIIEKINHQQHDDHSGKDNKCLHQRDLWHGLTSVQTATTSRALDWGFPGKKPVHHAPDTNPECAFKKQEDQTKQATNTTDDTEGVQCNKQYEHCC